MIYTVIGIYLDPLGQRFATPVEADSPEMAEVEAHAYVDEFSPGAELMVAGVVAGEVELLDMYTDGYSFGVPHLDSDETQCNGR